ncbi:MAG: class II aldolase/adducin family protein [Gammaproteobacteria bacterium]|jgi:ribulose-5-phosphate 4-epimerase/fuculose-1-phosphate aldolase|nr:class II aldolase [Chromatiales bacterium]MDP6415983.1 class II aldolase/adducin family protein [Gammaproteobacteria bacterium]MDP6675119.1 class II aldolase/adducin family protein [Gammaproteobacteria bacterium]
MNTSADTLSIRDQVSDEEWQMRVDLAACYRLIAMYGWDDLIFTHISVRIPGPDQHFLINAYGLLFEEITASNLIKVDLAGNKIMESPYPVNPAGFTIHSAVHEARSDIRCVLHTHTRAGVAVSTQQDGLLPLSQISLVALASIGYHDYEGIALNAEEKPRLVADLGDKLFLILRNHGLLTVGASIADAFLAMYALETACQAQVLAQSSGVPLVQIKPQILAGIAAQVEEVTKGLGGQLAWPGLLRKLDKVDPTYRD